MSSPLHREIDVPPYRIIVDARLAHGADSSRAIAGYVACAAIMRSDGAPVYESHLAYRINEGETFVDSECAIRDGEERARQDIRAGFHR